MYINMQIHIHELGEDEDRFTKEEIQAGHSKLVQTPGSNQTIVTGNGGPSGSGNPYICIKMNGNI
jgi:hypothetical protein